MCSAQGPAKCSVTEAREAAVYGRGMGGQGTGGRARGEVCGPGVLQLLVPCRV